MATLETQTAKSLKHIAKNLEIKEYVLNHEEVFTTLLKSARRFIAGTHINDCIKVAKEFNKKSIATTIDFMGEDTVETNKVGVAFKEFKNVITVIQDYNLKSSVSLDLSHVGLAVDKNMALDNLAQLAEMAETANIEIMISMEGSEKTELIFSVYEEIQKTHQNVGITLQAYLFRSSDDLNYLLPLNGKIRLVKGAFKEPESIAMPRGKELNERYINLLKQIVTSGKACSIATHDHELIRQSKELLTDYRAVSNAEFEMLLGVSNDTLEDLYKADFNTRVYLPFGEEWYLYFCHRLAENPQNVYQAIIDMVH